MKGNFGKLINGDKPVLIDFFATWCGPCKALTPVIKEVAGATKDKVRVVKMDVDKNQQIAQQFQVRGVPTLMLFQNGKVLWRQSGVQSKQQILQQIEPYI